MWLAVGLLFLGKGEAKGTGFICGLVGAVVVIGATIQVALFKDAFTAGLLYAHGLLYCTVAYALLAGLEDLRSVGNASLMAAFVSAIYMILFFTGGTAADGTVLIAKSNYFAFACLGYTVLTIEVWMNAFGKLSATLLAWSLIIWVPIGLLIPAFMLMASGTLPF
jgi:hypothetical protein